jgi:hypothetical protein
VAVSSQNVFDTVSGSSVPEDVTYPAFSTCEALHYLCDPSSCQQASVTVSMGENLGQAPYGPVRMTLKTLLDHMGKGCGLCAILHEGLNILAPRPP